MTKIQIGVLLGLSMLVSCVMIVLVFLVFSILLAPTPPVPIAVIPTNGIPPVAPAPVAVTPTNAISPVLALSSATATPTRVAPTIAPSVASATTSASTAPTIGDCPMFPPNNVWNTRIDTLPVDSNSATYINAIGANTSLHPDFGSALWEGLPIGIPFNLVPGTQSLLPITFMYSGESDPGPYPIPQNPLIERGTDYHVLVVDTGRCVLYETWDTHNKNGWSAGSGAKFDLRSNALRPAGWTSADAAGLPILPGLVRYSEVASGEIKHAIRFTINGTNGKSIWPARHKTSSAVSASKPPMGQRFRLKASFDISSFSQETRVILTAFKRYGIIVADNGSNWFITGAPDPHWKDETLVTEFRRVHGSDFEAIDESSLMLDPNSGQVK